MAYMASSARTVLLAGFFGERRGGVTGQKRLKIAPAPGSVARGRGSTVRFWVGWVEEGFDRKLHVEGFSRAASRGAVEIAYRVADQAKAAVSRTRKRRTPAGDRVRRAASG